MTEAVLFPDAEVLLVAYLSEALPGVPVSTKIPNPRPDVPFLRVLRVGGTRRDLVTDQPMVVVEAWAGDDGPASDLARLAQAYVFALAQTDRPQGYVRAVREVGGIADNPDPVSESPRFTFTVQIDTRGVPL